MGTCQWEPAWWRWELAGGSQPAGDGSLPRGHTASLAFRHQGGSYLCFVGIAPLYGGSRLCFVGFPPLWRLLHIVLGASLGAGTCPGDPGLSTSDR